MNNMPENPMLRPTYYERCEERRRFEEEAAHSAAEAFLVENVKFGRDVRMPWSGKSVINISDHLGECSDETKQMLLEACTHAMNGRDTEAGQALRRFVQRRAEDYADDELEQFLPK